MILYHGSIEQIERPIYGAGSATNDYGRGFYCTEDIELAKEWACLRGTDGFANQYELDLAGLDVMDLNGPGYNTLNWLALLAKHRSYWEKSSLSYEAKAYLQKHFLPDVSRADVVCGYRADDSYFTFAKNFVANGISLGQLQEAMRLGKLGEQVVLVSKRAFSGIRFMGAVPASGKQYAVQAQDKDKAARMAYRQLARTAPMENELYMLDIMRRGMTNEDFGR